jgi:AcrR family transcriptional regulator
MRSADLTATARIRDAAIEQFGQHGFGTGLRAIAEAAGVSAPLVIHHFGSKDGLRKVCDDYIQEWLRSEKSEALRNADAVDWLRQLSEIEDFAPMLAYLLRSLQSGGDLARSFMQRMIDNAEGYIEEGVRAGTIKPSRDPAARAKFLAMIGGGGLMLYIQMHDNPSDLRAVLNDYAQEMVLPAVELYTDGLLTDRTILDTLEAGLRPPENGAGQGEVDVTST